MAQRVEILATLVIIKPIVQPAVREKADRDVAIALGRVIIMRVRMAPANQF